MYYTYLNGGYDFDLNNFLGFPGTDERFKYNFKSNLVGFYSNYTLSKKNLTWTTGVHANLYDRQHIGSEKTVGQLYKNTGYKNELSAFTKVDYTYQRLTFFADIQYRYASFDYSGSAGLNKIEWHFLNPKAGVSVELKSGSVLYYSIGKTGREPTRNDMFGGNDDLSTDSIGNPVLSIKTPEYVVNHELGLRHSSQNINFNLNLFYMDFQNEIVLDGKFGPNGLALTDKVERSFRTGIELSITYKVSNHVTLVNNSSFNYSRIKEQKEIFTPILTPPLIINQEVVYSYKGFSSGLSARYQEKSFIDFANTSTVDSYFLFNGRVGYDINRFQLGFFLNNITNAKYINNGYIDFDGKKKFFVQAPTNFYVSIKYSF